MAWRDDQAMMLPIYSDYPPLREEESGAIRVGSSRVLLDLVIHAFQDGKTPEKIVDSYPTLKLSDVYSVIAYYLRHQGDVDNYLAEREQEAAEIRKEIEQRQGDLSELRERFRRIREQRT
jgi:uncharacterized protein (DUF433 family)